MELYKKLTAVNHVCFTAELFSMVSQKFSFYKKIQYPSSKNIKTLFKIVKMGYYIINFIFLTEKVLFFLEVSVTIRNAKYKNPRIIFLRRQRKWIFWKDALS